jgi:4-aminobutyrate aminotransferase-like enzyme
MTELFADQMLKDPRVKQAKALLLETLKDHQSKIQTIQEPQEPLKESYEKQLENFSQNRGGKLFFPYLGSGIGNGTLVELGDGSIKYDMICGIGPHYWGHSHPDIIAAEIDACLSDIVMQGHLQQNSDAAELVSTLTEASGIDHCFLSTTGVMANENALKIAFQNRHPAQRILAFEGCFAGRTLAVSQITDKPAYRKGLPRNMHVDYVPFFDAEDPEGSTERALNRLKEHLHRHPGEYAAMIFELVQGEAGFYPGQHEFFVTLMELLREHHVLIIDDEVQAFGRTSRLFAFQHFGLQKYVDIVTIGKLSQVCATLFPNELKPQPGLLSQTFIASTSAIRAANVIIHGLLDGGFFGEHGRIMTVHHQFTEAFNSIAERHPGLISGPYGIGSMLAFTPLDGSAEACKMCLTKLYENGVISFIAGSNPMRIRFLLPIGALKDADIQSVCKIVEQTLMECHQNYGSALV